MGRRVAVRVHLESDAGDPLVGKGRSRLLALVHQTGSISAAAREMGMSYRNAWGVLRQVASAAGGPVVESERGGARGGRTRLTELGRELLAEYSRAEDAIEEEARRGAYPHPRLTVDAVVVQGGRVLLVRRGAPPHEGSWALPGGFVRRGEALEEAVVRELGEETGLEGRVVGLVGAYSRPDRDPRGHTVSVVYALEVAPGTRPRGGDDAAEASWHDLSRPPRLAFDHSEVLDDLRRRGYLPLGGTGGKGGRGPRSVRGRRPTSRPRRS